MKIGLDTYSYRYAAGLWDYSPQQTPPMTIDHFLVKAAELGLEGVHLTDPRHFDNLEYGYISEVRRKAERLELYLELGTAGTNPDHLQTMVRTAHVLGASLVRTFLGKPRPVSAAGMARLITEAAEQLSQASMVCERYGVSLALENHQDLTTAELMRLVETIGSDWVGVCFDTGNSLALLEDPVESLASLGPYVKTVHLKDYQLAARRDGFCLIACALGDGVVDLNGIVEQLRSVTPEVNLNIETYLGKHYVPALEGEYLRRLPEMPVEALGWTLRLVRDKGLPKEPLTPEEMGAAEQDILAAEEEIVLQSVKWAQRALGLGAFKEVGE